MSHDPSALPAGLPAPVDDGAADLLPGRVLPDIALPATPGGPVDLRRHGAGRRLVVSAHPRTGRPGVDPPTGWDEIPGARGCTPEACASRDLAAQFATLHVEVLGRSSQDPDHQLQAAIRLHLPHAFDTTVGAVLRGEHPGRQTDEQVTAYSPVGLPLQDCVIAWHAHRRAAARGVGLAVDLGQ